MFYTAYLANALRAKLRYAAIIGSYGWSRKAIEQIVGLIPNLKVELLVPVLCRGYPQDETFAPLDRVTDTVAGRHATR